MKNDEKELSPKEKALLFSKALEEANIKKTNSPFYYEFLLQDDGSFVYYDLDQKDGVENSATGKGDKEANGKRERVEFDPVEVMVFYPRDYKKKTIKKKNVFVLKEQGHIFTYDASLFDLPRKSQALPGGRVLEYYNRFRFEEDRKLLSTSEAAKLIYDYQLSKGYKADQIDIYKDVKRCCGKFRGKKKSGNSCRGFYIVPVKYYKIVISKGKEAIKEYNDYIYKQEPSSDDGIFDEELMTE